MATGINKLSPSAIRKLLKAGKPGRTNDGAGLYLQISEGGTASWLWLYTMNGRSRQLGLGSLKSTTLAEARIKARSARSQLDAGVDPIEAKQAARISAKVQMSDRPTFAQAAQDFMEAKAPEWKNEKHRQQWQSTLDTYAMPILGKLDVASVDTALILRVLKPVWTEKPDTAARLRGRIESILDAARAAGHREGDNPARLKGHLDHLLPAHAKIKKVRPMPAMPYQQLPKFMPLLRKRQSTSARALELLILTASRTGALIGMRSEEIDFKQKVWTCPGDRMKAGREHLTPLCDRAIEIIRTTPREKGSEFIFVGNVKGQPISNMAMLALMKHIAPEYVCHGFRSSFSDWAHETTSTPHHVVEMSLAHAVENKTEAAYRRGHLLEKRRELMALWQDYLYASVGK